MPPNPGNNYFRLNVNLYEESRKANVYQEIILADLSPVLKQDTVIAVFHVDIASNYNTPKNCSFAEVKVLFFNSSGAVVDSIYVKESPNEFRDLDAGTPEAEERGFNVMHEFKPFSANLRVSLEAVKARIEAYCEFPCNKFVNEDEEESEAENSNTFFFDNFSLGFYKK